MGERVPQSGPVMKSLVLWKTTSSVLLRRRVVIRHGLEVELSARATSRGLWVPQNSEQVCPSECSLWLPSGAMRQAARAPERRALQEFVLLVAYVSE